MNKYQTSIRGGNGNIVFDEIKGIATKYLRNNSSREKILRFKQEIEVYSLQKEKHIPNIVEIEEININEDAPQDSYVIMKKYDGSLNDLAPNTKGKVRETLELILPIIKALQVLSQLEKPIFHRDIKPDNILYLKRGQQIDLFLTDFGICFINDNNERFTKDDEAIGARMFIAPEYEIGKVEEVNESGDIFSLGKVIWWMINGSKEEYLPSNFWFLDNYNLTHKFEKSLDFYYANLIISMCTQIDCKKRCNYNTLIEAIEKFIHGNIHTVSLEKALKVQEFQERRNIELKEISEKNKLLVNLFSEIYLQTLRSINQQYSTFKFTQKLEEEYLLKRGHFVSSNVDKNQAHYLYSTSFDRIYIAIDFNPASKGEIYCSIKISYNISQNGKNNSICIYYGEANEVLCKYDNKEVGFSVETLFVWIEKMVMDYID